MKKIVLKKLIIPTLGIFFAANVTAQESTDTKTVKEVVVTGVTNPKAALESSISITTLRAKDINNAVPRTTAEIFRTIPGIRSEASGGDGNSNITVRGVPVSAGGSRYMLIQEDGLPVLQFGDIAFGTQDQFIRFDNTTSRIEALRGGSASVLASNSPAGIINFISKTGEAEGGSLTQTFGLGYKLFRTDFEYGSKLAENLFYHVGGFFRTGDGPRATGFTSNNGGQFKMSLTKKFDDGQFRVYAKLLSDRTAAYMPAPIGVSGTDDAPVYESLANYDALYGTMYTPHLQHDVTTNAFGQKVVSDIADGMHSESKSLGFEFSKGLGDGYSINVKARHSINNGQFLAPFPEGTISATSMKIHLFNTKLNNFNNTIGDISLSKKFNDILKVNVGLYKSNQNLNMDWHWNTYNQDVDGSKANSTFVAMGVPAWGNCCNRNYNTTYDIIAPYGNIEVQADKNWNLDFGMRLDRGFVSGDITEATTSAVNYDYALVSGSAGINYLVDDNSSFFARASRGGTAQADRILFNGANYTNNDDALIKSSAVNIVTQGELGMKKKFEAGTLNATAFYTLTAEGTGFEASTQKIISNDFTAYGLEVDGNYKFTNKFNLRGSATYTKAEISASNSAAEVGMTPRRTPALMFSLNPNLSVDGGWNFGLTAIGATSAFTQNNNKLTMPAYVLVNPYINYAVNKSIQLNLAASNVFDALAITEAEEGSIADGKILGATTVVRARPYPGRTVSAAIKFNF